MGKTAEESALSVVEWIGSCVGSVLTGDFIVKPLFEQGDDMTFNAAKRKKTLTRCRAALAVFIVGLVLSGVTAFPLLAELNLLSSWLGIDTTASPEAYVGLHFWISTVRLGLERADAAYPWLAYGTDWLAFAHLTIAVFFIGPLVDPARNRWVLISGIIACAAVVPTALIAGAVRGIPLYWRLIDCSFGVFGAIPLIYSLRLSMDLEEPI